MDITSLIEIVIAIVVVYFFIKLIVSPVIKAVIGVLTFLVAIYLLQHFLGFDLTKLLGPWGKYLNVNKLGLNLNWIFGPAYYYIDKIKSFLTFIWGNYPKNQ